MSPNLPGKASLKDATEILLRFQTMFKLVKYYEPNNTMVQEQMGPFFEMLRGVLEHDNTLQINISQNSVFFNRTRIKFDSATYHVYKFLTGAFQEWQLGALTLSAGLTREEMTRFMVFLANLEIAKDDPFEHLLQEFQTGSFPHIAIEAIGITESSENRDKNAARTYFLGIYHLKELFDRNREMLNFNLTKRWIQSMFNHIASNEAFVQGLANTKNFDEYTLNHSVNVCVLALGLGRRLGLSRQELTELGISAFLHDLGKLEIPKEILDKPAKLDPSERSVMEGHSRLGAERLVELARSRNVPFRAIQVALEHHTRADLGGYPKYIHKKDINLYSKIVQIADTFDAMTSKRVFRRKIFTKEEALSMMLEKSGMEFDPVILRAFISMVGVYPVGSLVFLNTGEIGIVFANNPHASFVQRPKVKLIADAEGNKMDGPIVDLTEVDPASRKFLWTIIKTLDPDTYNIQVADYFLARVQ
ncbi:MAG: HD-GYP domain-containing protein [Candidatus Aminicenantes bacterium]|nr:HD-GYP domain-containing protein [Candidatus Aminicenantes bacterium]